MWLFGKKPQLVRALDSLAIYNDKGVAWSRHSPEQAVAERSSRMAKIRALAATIGHSSLPQEFMTALESGHLALDCTGRYAESVKGHFRHG